MQRGAVFVGAAGVLLALVATATATYRPVVLSMPFAANVATISLTFGAVHGILSTSSAMAGVKTWIEADFPGIYVHNMDIGSGENASLFININQQVEMFAKTVASDPQLANGFNLIGHSQGGLITRAYVERYNNPPVHNLISWAGPNDGVYGVPDFNLPFLDKILSELLQLGVVSTYLQEHLSAAAYWKNPYNYTNYLNENIFLADINNERPAKNQTYKENLLSLANLLLVDSTADTVVIPFSSPWFQFYALNQSTTIVPLQQTAQYSEDWLGLKSLDGSGRLHLQQVNCSHSQFPEAPCKWAYDLFTRPLLDNTL